MGPWKGGKMGKKSIIAIGSKKKPLFPLFPYSGISRR
jgi:hypothetical protein